MVVKPFPESKLWHKAGGVSRLNKEAISALIASNVTVFEHDYGTKKVIASWSNRRKAIINSVDDVDEYKNYHIITGDNNIVDIDLDCLEAIKLALYFLPATNMKYGRESNPLSHWLYKVIDLTKKHTRKYFSFEDPNINKETLVELRAHDHYTMCSGKYPEEEYVKWSEFSSIKETTYDVLFKSVAMLAVASIILRNYPTGDRNVYIWQVAGTLWHHKVEEDDALKIIEAVCVEAGDEEVKGRLAKAKHVYKTDTPQKEIVGLPTLAKDLTWTDKQITNLKEALYAVTGRSELPTFTHDFVNRIAYMMKQKKYYDLEDKEMYDGEAVDVKYSKYFDGRYTPLKFWKQHPDSKVCVDFTYKPNDQKRFVHVDKKLMINVFEKNELLPDHKVDTDAFWALLKHVIPHEECREHFLDWYAFPLQNPGIKIRHAIIMQSDEFQLGKGSLFDLHRLMLGNKNTRKIELAEALDKGKNYLLNYQTVLIDEAKSSGSWSEKAQLINTLKTIITEGSIGVRQLYKEYSEQDTCTNYWINTNYKDAFPLPKNEVRYWVYFSPAKRNQQMLDDFHNAKDKDNLAGGVMAELLDRNLSKFNPLAPAPYTEYRNQMSGMADRPLNDFIREQFEQGVHPFDRDMLTTVELFEYLKVEKRLRVTREREVANALELLGAKCRKQIPIATVADRATLWVLRDHDTYMKMPAAELGKKYVPFYNDSKAPLKKAVATPMREHEKYTGIGDDVPGGI